MDVKEHSRILARKVWVAVTQYTLTFMDWLQDVASTILRILDWFVAVAERLLVLSLAGLIFYFGYLILFGKVRQVNEYALKEIAGNWKAALVVLLIPLFYRTVRMFLEKARKFAGIEAGPPEEEESAKPNP